MEMGWLAQLGLLRNVMHQIELSLGALRWDAFPGMASDALGWPVQPWEVCGGAGRPWKDMGATGMP
jgi:hypothetical protein